MKQTTIPAGYRLTVTSWENDGDNYNTKVREGLTKQHTIFLVSLCKLLSNKNLVNHNHKTRLDNMYDASPSEVERVNAALAETTHLTAEEEFDSDEAAAYYAQDFLQDLGLSGEDYITRVCESYKVEYIPTDVTLEDVTEQF